MREKGKTNTPPLAPQLAKHKDINKCINKIRNEAHTNGTVPYLYLDPCSSRFYLFGAANCLGLVTIQLAT